MSGSSRRRRRRSFELMESAVAPRRLITGDGNGVHESRDDDEVLPFSNCQYEFNGHWLLDRVVSRFAT